MSLLKRSSNDCRYFGFRLFGDCDEFNIKYPNFEIAQPELRRIVYW